MKTAYPRGMNDHDYEGLYGIVWRHLTRTREWPRERAMRYLQTKPFKLLCRVNNRLVRTAIVVKHNYCELRGGKIFVSRVMEKGGSSFVPL